MFIHVKRNKVPNPGVFYYPCAWSPSSSLDCWRASLRWGPHAAAQIPNQGVPAAQALHTRQSNIAVELGRLTASDAGGDFGYTVAIDGDTIVVGAQGDDEQAGNAGAVYVFLRPGSGWVDGTETAKLTASDGAIADGLGSWVAISGNIIVAGATRGWELRIRLCVREAARRLVGWNGDG